MKRQFSHRRNSSQNSLRGLVWTFGGVLAVFGIFILVRVFLPGTFIALATPFWNEGTTLDTNLGSTVAGLGNAQTLARQNAALANQVLTLQNENDVLTARDQDLTKLLGGQNTTEQHGIVAGVLARPPESPYDTLVVGAGSSDAVVVGSQVYSSGGIPIGTVESVTAHSAIIGLLSTPGRVTNGWAGTNRTPVTLTGTGAGTFSATLSKAAAISVGDTIYVPGPGAIPVGTVLHINSDPSSPTMILDIQPLVNLFSLTWVEIVPST